MSQLDAAQQTAVPTQELLKLWVLTSLGSRIMHLAPADKIVRQLQGLCPSQQPAKMAQDCFHASIKPNSSNTIVSADDIAQQHRRSYPQLGDVVCTRLQVSAVQATGKVHPHIVPQYFALSGGCLTMRYLDGKGQFEYTCSCWLFA